MHAQFRASRTFEQTKRTLLSTQRSRYRQNAIKLNVESAGELERPMSTYSRLPPSPHEQQIMEIDEEMTNTMDVARTVMNQERDYKVRKSIILAQMSQTVDDFKRNNESYKPEMSIRSGLKAVPTIEESRRYN